MKRLRFLVSLMTRENDYQLEQAESAQAASAKLGVDLQIIFADNDAVTQGTQVLKVIQSDAASRPDAILCEPVGGTCLPQVARASVAAGIGWMILNRHADYLPQLRSSSCVPVASISADQKEVGRIQGKQFAALARSGGSVLYIQGPSENAAAKERTVGMEMTLPHAISVTSLRGQWTEESAYRCIQSWMRLTTSSKMAISVVGAQNDAMALGAKKALSDGDVAARQKWSRVPFTGCDGVPKTGQAWVRDGSLAATVIIPTTAGEGMALMARALQTGVKLPEMSFSVPESFPPLDQLSAK